MQVEERAIDTRSPHSQYHRGTTSTLSLDRRHRSRRPSRVGSYRHTEVAAAAEEAGPEQVAVAAMAEVAVGLAAEVVGMEEVEVAWDQEAVDVAMAVEGAAAAA